VEQFRKAIYLLREAGFKVDLHFMPDLPGTTPEHDVEMYQLLFSDLGLRPDMVKIYPNAVIPSAELYQWYLDGRFKPYGEEGLFRALLEMKLATPRYCRISRLIRDIPANEIEAGNKITNLREMLETELKKRGQKCVCLRCREVSRQKNNIPVDTVPMLFVDEYDTIGGKEYFITLEDEKRIAVFGFLRLRIPHGDKNEILQKQFDTLMPEIKNCAFVRELHVYGTLVGIGKRNIDASQHKGFGKRLMAEAERIAKEKGLKKVAVISGVGVRGYYRKLGYRLRGTYMIKTI
jgi:elongator complex protein 3